MNINSAEYKSSSPRADMCPDTSLPEYAFIGRSNVGKSSLINMLTRHSKLAKTSQTPGKTLLINHFLINGQWYLVDLPGYGYAQRGKKEMEKLKNLINHYVLERTQLTLLFVLIDIRHEPQQKDLDFLSMCGENGIPIALIFTKADKLTRAKIQANTALYLDQLKQQWEELPPHFITSSENGMGRDEVLGYIEEINKELKEMREP